ncbi:MAG: hypothetical protein ACYC01_02225 [Lutibacter sp.]
MDNFLNMDTINNIDWDWVLNKIFLFLYFYILIYYTKFGFIQQLLSFENDYGKRTENKLVFFIQSFLYTSISLLLVPIGIIFFNLFEDPDMHIVNLMIVTTITIILYCFKNAYFYVYLDYEKSTLKTLIQEQENKLKNIKNK